MLSDSGPAGKELMQESAIEADDVAAALLAAIEAEQFLVLPTARSGPCMRVARLTLIAG